MERHTEGIADNMRKFKKWEGLRFVWLKVVPTDWSLFRGEAPRFSADFVHPLSSERPFKFPRHLVRALEINGIIAMSDKNIRSAVFN